MKEIRPPETEKEIANEYIPRKEKQPSVYYKHRIRCYEWAIRLMRVFIWTMIIWLVRKLIKKPIGAIKKWITF